jgi:hypothetical protein
VSRPREAAAIRAFVTRPRRDRLLTLLADPVKRDELTGALAHLADLDPRHAVPISPERQTAAAIAALLRERDAPATCDVLADDEALDGRTMDLDEALEAVVGRCPALLVCVPDRLAYYEGEAPGRRLILARS